MSKYDLMNRQAYANAQTKAMQINQQRASDAQQWNQQHSQSDMLRRPVFITAEDVIDNKLDQ